MITNYDKETLNEILSSHTSQVLSVGRDFLKDVATMLNEMDECTKQSMENKSSNSIIRTFNGVELSIALTDEEIRSIVKDSKEIVKESDKHEFLSKIGNSLGNIDDFYLSDYCICELYDVLNEVEKIVNEDRDADVVEIYPNVDFTISHEKELVDFLENKYPVYAIQNGEGKLTNYVFDMESKTYKSFSEIDKELKDSPISISVSYIESLDKEAVSYKDFDLSYIDFKKIFEEGMRETEKEKESISYIAEEEYELDR